ncbi:glucose-6-phosphate dehydrogenase [Campylobacter sp. RM12640]|uniref:glucose-6-phosphate dehydrogenase n=1 Tax=unclassified Campylobacter TaxID=2593542 RepID=UPI001BD91BDA|nr:MULTISPECIES: glucose-6-phosphate dehydrogenase [unclassified Campylobacter]MBZ7976565.1 glucose-6-phosphate dehydrogenase [Campylobacter sp. RM12637]MBZ7981920.1 glucose-6-phosphate dehydrogenase [Campylobacter sp. RM12640]MBZ7989173.1 glucose-6-phosphate dehydrogenase [Campylobacter sp. RM12635]MBZ7991146.1 glucose-6-phosphate dehydrogenase [Campylobacter sp. RM9331]MBZ8005639.1 glucose-6-phosphate dehydrogenase [Campylobacter sp. RM9332]
MKTNFDFLLFGATGDLALRKLFPSLYEAFLNDLLHEDFKILATGRSKLSLEEFKQKLNDKSKIHLKDTTKWNDFLEKISYESVDINNLEDFKKLKNNLRDGKDTIIYFSISPEFFITCCKNLSELNMNKDNVRIVLEKPLGMSLNECRAINESVAKYYKEEQIYRIDHYLGKSMVKELFEFRKQNPHFNALLNKDYVKSINLYVLERLGVESRGEFYDSCGALRDMLQNHMLQMLALFMIDINSTNIRKAKLEFFNSLEKIDFKNVIKAQYEANEDSLSYLDELNVAKDSRTETFVSIKTSSNQENYKGVLIKLATGKRMAENKVYFDIDFKNGGKMYIEIQPKPKIKFLLKIAEEFKEFEIGICDIEKMPPYERLLLNVINKDLSSFNEKDELESAWKWVQDVIDNDDFTMHKYKAYTNEIIFKD